MATLTVTPIRTFTSGETVTPTKLNELSQPNVALTAASIVEADLANGAVTTAKIANANVTTAKIADTSVTPIKLSQPFTLRTSQFSTSGSFVDFTDIPSWAKRITVMLYYVSFNGTADMLIQLGSGSFKTSQYASWSNFLYGGVGSGLAGSAAGFPIYMSSSTNVAVGAVRIHLVDYNIWVAEGVGTYANSGAQWFTAGSVPLSGVLDRVRITRSNATDTFDAGTINISYEG